MMAHASLTSESRQLSLKKRARAWAEGIFLGPVFLHHFFIIAPWKEAV